MTKERETPEKTPLDEALETAKQDKTQANFFYDVFLNTELFIPVQLEATEIGTWRKIGMQEKFRPLFVPSGETKVVPAFDNFDRLREWADGTPLDFVELKAHVFLRILGKGVAIVLNAGTDYSYVFSGELLEKLKAAMKPVRPS